MKTLGVVFTLAAIFVVAAPTFAQTTPTAGEVPSPWAAPSWEQAKEDGDIVGYGPNDARPHGTPDREQTVAIARAIAKRLISEAFAAQGQVPGSGRTHTAPPGSTESAAGATSATGTATPPSTGAAPAQGSAPATTGTTPAAGAAPAQGSAPTTSTTSPAAASGTPVPGPVVNNFITTAPAPTGGTGSYIDPDEVHREVEAYLEGVLGPEGKKLVPKVLPLLIEELEVAGLHVPTREEWDALQKATADNTAAIARNSNSIAALRNWGDGIVRWGRRTTALSVIALILAIIALILVVVALLRRRAVAAPDDDVAERLDEFGGRLDAVEGVAADALRRANLAGDGALYLAEATFIGEDRPVGEDLLRRLRAAFGGPPLR